MIQFKKVILHNFGSYGHAELELQNQGFCLVSGQNNYPKDNAMSNGAGKSFLWSAICFALTGETINGIKSNLKNINIDEPECYVQLDFSYGKDLFSLHRIIAPKSDLKIFKNDIELSGKGIRESEKKLQDLLPELNKDLIASTIIIGQGMPNKFSSFSPSGRKDLLEKLTKSDFMIEDLKSRISGRYQELTIKIREYEDSLLANRTQLNTHLAALDRLRELDYKKNHPDFDIILEASNKKIQDYQNQGVQLAEQVAQIESDIEKHTARLLALNEEKSGVKTEEFNAYNEALTKLVQEKTSLNLEVANLEKEIIRLKAIVDVCPTCKQKLPNVVKPDTSEQESLKQDKQNKLLEVLDNINNCEARHIDYTKQIDEAYKTELTTLTELVQKLKLNISQLKDQQAELNSLLELEKTEYNKIVYDKQNWEALTKKRESEIASLEAEVAKLTNVIAVLSLAKDDLDQRINIIKRMDQLIRRDFRGYLLTNIIAYIDARAKDYCNIVFGTRDLSLALNGNALDITYCGKLFDGLSGGEKQRVDLILQLAIRDLLTSYLGLSANILVLDEITDFLDRKSCQAVMRLLEKELNTVESVFIISHHAEELEIPVDSEIKVIKNESGISEILK